MSDKKPRRSTRQRRVILEELRKLNSHPTAVDLYEIARRRLPKLSLGTVYRNLEVLARCGDIQKLELTNGESRFDGNPAQHCHVRCVRCGRVDDVRDPASYPRLDRIRRLGGFAVLGYNLEFVGVCTKCRASTKDGGELPRTTGA
jgi:Fur family ferric uptake transcriptional regulator